MIAEREVIDVMQVVQQERNSSPTGGFQSGDAPVLRQLRSAVEAAKAHDVDPSVVQDGYTIAEAAEAEAVLGTELSKWVSVSLANETMLPGMAQLKEAIEQAQGTQCSTKMLEQATKMHRRLEVELEYQACMKFDAIEVRAL